MWSFAKWKGKRTKLSNTIHSAPCALLISPRTVWSGCGWVSVLFEDLEKKNLCNFIHASVSLFLYNWLLVLHQGKKIKLWFPPPKPRNFLWIKMVFFLSQRFVCFLLCIRTLRLYFTPTVVTFHKSNYCTSPKSLRKVSCRDLEWAPALLVWMLSTLQCIMVFYISFGGNGSLLFFRSLSPR